MSYETNKWATDDLITHQKLNNIEDGVTMALEKVVYGTGGAQVPSEGHHTTIWLNEGDPMPGNPTVTDVVYVKNGDDYIIYEWDGSAWAVRLDPRIGERVDTAVKEAKEYSDNLVIENNTEVNNTINEVKAEQENLQKGIDQLDTKAQGYANKALEDAKANTLATAAQTAKDASDALAKVKTDLTTSLNKEVTDRANAVTALDTKAKGYADTAKNDAISASTTALNTAKTDLTTSITKEVSDRTKAVSDLDTKAQGYATRAKTDAIATANDAVAKEVTDRQKAITDLDAKSTGAINQAKTDAQSALDALQVGGRNLLLNSKALWPVSNNGGTIAQESFDSATNMWHITSPVGSGINKGIYFGIAKNTSMPIPVGQPWTMSFDIKGTGLFKQVGPENSTTKGPTGNVPTDWTRVSATGIRGTANNIVLYFDVPTVDLDIYIKLPKLEIGNKATDYTQAPEDIVLDYTTKDNVISQSLTQYQATNDGKVTKAQSDATQALGLVATKVSQTTFDTKTGDLDSKYTTVKQTVDTQTTDIADIKKTNTSQDAKLNTIQSDVSGTKQSISDIQTEQGKQSTKINTIQTDVSGTKQDISDIKDANGVQDDKITSISTTVDGLSSSFSTYKTTNDGKVAKAQADITANATAISQKVSQTAYDAKTGQLQTDLNTTTTTANQAKTDIIAIKKTDTDQDARMTTIESDANGVKTTVSSLQTTANTQAGSISTLQQRADGFDATVSTLGQINQLFNTEFTPDFAGWHAGISPSSGMYKTGNSLSSDISWSIGSGKYNGSTVLKHVYGSGNMAFFSDLIPVGEGVNITGSIVAMSTPEFTGSVSVAIYLRYYDSNKNYIGVQSADSGKWSTWTQKYIAQVTPTGAAYVSFNIQTNGNAGVTYYSQPMLTFSNKVGKYVQGNYNNNASVAKAQLTADNASLAISNYKTDADGRISKAQSDIVVNANAITQKVSQTDYNAKTGDLTTKVNTAQSTADSANSTISAYKTSNDGRVATAESNITQNANAIATKVSQTVYDAKTNQLQTDLNTTTTTANQAKTDIVAIKSDNTKQDARMTTIESDANGTKTTVSNLQTDLGKANGSITTLQQRADGIEATVSTLGQINQLLNTEFTPDFAGWYTSTNAKPTDVVTTQLTPVGTDGFGSNVVSHKGGGNWINSAPIPVTSGMVLSFSSRLSVPKTVTSGVPLALYIKAFDANNSQVLSSGYNVPVSQLTATPTTFKIENVMMPAGAVKAFAIYGWNVGDEVYISQPMLVFKDKVGAYVQGAYSNSISTAKAQLTADQATTSLNNYKTDADGRISKAQADIIVNANAITQKVSQSDYNAKTGDLTTKVNTAQSTADSATSTIGAYKTSNDARVASAESKITANANAITSKVSQSDYNTKTGQIDGQISSIKQTATSISQSVADVNGRIDNISVGGTNLLLGSQDFTGTGTERWVISGTIIANAYQGLSAVQSAGAWSGPKYQESNLVSRWGALDTVHTFTLSEWVRNTSTTQVDIKFYGDNVQGSGLTVATLPANSDWVRVSAQFKFLVATPSSGARIRFEPITGVTGGYVQHAGMKLESGTLASSYSPAPEDTDNKISTVSQTVDNISSIVSDPTTGLTKRVQTAEGTLSQVTGADIPALQKATYWQAPNGYDLNTYLTQGSFFFNNTNARTNNPKADNGWMYLVVEQANGGSRVTQTAWYDTQTDAKITYRRQYAGTWGAWYANDNDSVTSIAQTNGAIQTEISNRQTGDTNTLTQAKDFTTSSISNSESGMRSQITQTSDAILGKVGAVNLFSNSEFEKDYGYRTKNPGVTLSLDTKNQIGTQYNGTVNVAPTSTGWQGYWARNIEVQGGQKYSGSVLVHYTNGGVTGGNAVLDIWFIDKDGNRINQGTGGSRSIGTGQVSSPYWVKLYFEGVTAPDNAVNLQVSLLTNDKGVGQTAMFTQPMVTATEKLQPYTPNNDITTQLALLKDNWSIGITDNTSKLASGIAGDANAMAIVSPKVIINSPQTQITGKLAAAQIDTKELSAISAVLGNVSSGSITNPISGQRSGHGNATISGKTVIDAGGINMTADMLVGGTKVNSEQLQFSPDTGIIFKWNNSQGNVVRNTTVDEYGVTVSSGGPYTAGFSEMGFDIGNNVGGSAQVGVGGVYSTEFQRYRQSFTGQNLEIKLDFIRQGNLVMVNTNIVTYGPTLQGDAALMSGGKIPVGFRPVWPVDMVLNANSSGGSQSGMIISLDTTGNVYKTGPAWGSVMRVMGHTTYMTFTVGPSTQNYTAVSDGYGNITP